MTTWDYLRNETGSFGFWLFMPLVILSIFVIHFLPTIIGFKRPDRLLIFLINLLAGWSIIGWLIALYLSLRKDFTPHPFSSSPAFAGAMATSVADELAKLRDLRDQGVLTPEEFERQKNNLIS